MIYQQWQIPEFDFDEEIAKIKKRNNPTVLLTAMECDSSGRLTMLAGRRFFPSGRVEFTVTYYDDAGNETEKITVEREES